MSSSHRNSLNAFLAGLELEGNLCIDVGGSQVPLYKRVKKLRVGGLLIADLPHPHEDSPEPDIVLDLNKPFSPDGINKDAWPYRNSADIITCFEVFDYVFLPGRAMKTIACLLNPGGVAYISYCSQYPLHQPVEDDALRYMPGGIKKLADYAGLEILEMIKRRPETDLFEQFYRAERMRAAKHEDHRFTGLIVKFRKAET